MKTIEINKPEFEYLKFKRFKELRTTRKLDLEVGEVFFLDHYLLPEFLIWKLISIELSNKDEQPYYYYEIS